MAFRQPTRRLSQRVVRPDAESIESWTSAAPVFPTDVHHDNQTWVVFSPATDGGEDTTYLSSVQNSSPTPGRSRFSDIGSLNTIARSELSGLNPTGSVVTSEAIIGDDNDENNLEDDAELDSLDSHLPDFRAQNSQVFTQASQILPAHDGLGSFRIDVPGTESEMQDRMFAFERFNPRRIKRRRESLGLARLDLGDEDTRELERVRRIEEWQLEQSRVLLEEIRKETRRRRLSETSVQRWTRARASEDEEQATLSTVVRPTTPTSLGSHQDWHDQDASCPAREGDGLLSRITRTVICDLMGIDTKLLSILLNEALPDDTDDLSSTASPSPDAFTKNDQRSSLGDSSWQLRILERVARELGLLVNHFTSHPHPGAFSTYVQVQQMPLPYAGLPAIPEAVADSNDMATGTADKSTPSLPQFLPTVAQGPAQDSLGCNVELSAIQQTGSSSMIFTQQEWEQDLDVKLVFRYLRGRFMSHTPPSVPFVSTPTHLAASSAQDAAAKAARVRQYHPLVSRARQADRRTFRMSTQNNVAMRHNSSCASHSTKKSGRRGSITMSSRHSSRHYWDIGGSIGTGSLIASTGPMGSWAEC
ncbi:hypothetical protein NKR23_g7684 [Pleurostoma richardsiae]|uniref:Uncharacterized protein n=1 Tax=Pleurostoma richardsiae TaxID=41990 RepID=A0AA38RB00_9PEZI|nr:hypothetical protein NKR23_g7684 [Pleurostoma richardsiae]